MIADLHCHYPMHVLSEKWGLPPDQEIRRPRKQRSLLDRIRIFIFRRLAREVNYPGETLRWRVDLDGLVAAEARLVLSALYLPWSEIDIDELPQGAPDQGYFTGLIKHIGQVEADLGGLESDRHLVVKTAADLDRVGDRVGIVHCVEGGFHIGARDHVEENVKALRKQGVAYVTLAHLFYRGIATNVNALPMIKDKVYDRIFCQPKKGLSSFGREIVEAMYQQRILIDVSHMREAAMTETFELLRDLDAKYKITDPTAYPVLATHAGFRFGEHPYMLEEDSVREIARRGGVVGLILGRHLLQDGLTDGDKEAHSEEILRQHITALHAITKSYDHIGIGSDLDGFIKPTMAGFEHASDLGKLKTMISRHFPRGADAILYRNAQRVIAKAFAAPV